MIDRSIQYNSRKDHLQMDTSFIKGVVVPILTICDKDEKIDEAKQRAQVDYVIKGGVTRTARRIMDGYVYVRD